MAHYTEFLFNEHWGEALKLYKEIEVAMTCQGLSTDQAKELWAPFFDWVRASPQDFSFTDEPTIRTGRARGWWAGSNPTMVKDDRPDGNAAHTFWREAFWGQNYARLIAIKDRYDAEGLFVVHHGVGSEEWSADGFERRT